jgi:AmmeMemoRadiSam system protein B/AmmeMemoRadiSam system protein A
MSYKLHIGILLLLAVNTFAMSRYPESQKVRKPAVAGSFYPVSSKEIKSMLGPWMHPSGNVAPQALIVPHAGYVFSGEVAASAFNQIPRGHRYERIFLLGPSHRVGFNAASVDTLYSFAETPLGQVPIDIAIGNELIKRGEGAFTFRSDAHDREHCLEVQLPLMQMAFDEVPPIVPIVIGSQHLDVLQQIAEVLEPYFTPENLFVISSDFSHYPSYEDAKKSDLFLAETITSGGLEDFLKALTSIDKMDFRGEDTAACGACAIAVLLDIMDAQGRGYFEAEHVMYRNSGDSVYGDKDRVVGYNSIVFTRKEKPVKDTSDHLFNFSDQEKKAMIATARQAIYSALRLNYDGDARPVGILKEKGYGVFVTLQMNGRLRGCIGRFTSDDTLAETIREMAQSAAFHDPRFPSLSRNEAHQIDIEVSVLSPLKKIESIDEFKLGRDGIYIIKGRHHGTFLPQVAEETGWDTEEFLGHCARDKAGIGWDGWKDADLYTYQTEVVNESEL